MTKPFDPSTIPVTLELHNQLGHKIFPQITGQHVAEAIRYFGQGGWLCGEQQPGGIELPLIMFPVFNFAAIGIQNPFVKHTKNGPKLTLRQHGETYFHRFEDDNAQRGLPAAVWFSRGAKQSDPYQYREKSRDNEFVRLITFTGSASISRQLIPWCIPGSVDNQGQIIQPHHTLPGADGQRLQNAIDHCLENLRTFRQQGPTLPQIAESQTLPDEYVRHPNAQRGMPEIA